MNANWRRVLPWLLASAIVLGSMVQAAHPLAAQSSDIIVSVSQVDTSSFPTVRAYVSVRNRNGVPIPELAASSFEIVEDGSTNFPPDMVESSVNPSAPTSLAIVIDLYRTMEGEPIQAAQSATQNLLEELLNEPNDPDRAAFVGVWSDISTDPNQIDPNYEVDFTNDRNMLLNVIGFLQDRLERGAGTPLYDAVMKALRLTAGQPIGRRAVIVMTDGLDGGSLSADSDTIQQATSDRTPVYTIGLSNSRLDERYLTRLAELSGGSFQATEDPAQLTQLFQNVLQQLRTEYVITYNSRLDADGMPHNVLVRVTTPTGLQGLDDLMFNTPGSGQTEPAPVPVEETVEPVQSTPTPAPTPTPTPAAGIGGVITQIVDTAQANPILVVGAVALAFLFFLFLLIVIILLIRRRRQRDAYADTGQEAIWTDAGQDLGPPTGGPAMPAGAAPPPTAGPGYGAPPPTVGPAYGAPPPTAGRTPGAPQPTVGAPPVYGEGSAAPPAAPQWPPAAPDAGVAVTAVGQRPPASPPAPPPAPRPAPPAAAPPPPQAPAAAGPAEPAGSTRLIDRSAKPTQYAMLVDRKRPDRKFDVAQPNVSIGRSQNNECVIDNGTVSRQHAVIKTEGDAFRVIDLGSSNGTFVNGERVTDPVPLHDGDVLRIGEVEFVFKVIPLK